MKSQHGFSLVSVLVASALLGIISLGIATIMTRAISSQNFIDVRGRKEVALGAIREILKNSQNCRATMRGPGPNAGMGPAFNIPNSATSNFILLRTLVRERDAVNSNSYNIRFQTGANVEDDKLLIEDMRLVIPAVYPPPPAVGGSNQLTAGTTDLNGFFEVRFKVADAIAQASGGPTDLGLVSVSLKITRVGTSFDNCYALSDGEDSLWQRFNPTQKIYYMGDHVGIGTTDPGTRLQVIDSTQAHIANFMRTDTVTDQFISVRGSSGGIMLGIDGNLPNVNGSGLIQTGVSKGLGFVVGSDNFGATSPALFISSSGNVGVGTTVPGALLSVNGQTTSTSLNVTGATTSGSLVVSGSTRTGPLTVNGLTTTDNLRVTSQVNGPVMISGTTTITTLVVNGVTTAGIVNAGATTARSLTVNGATNVNGSVTVRDNITARTFLYSSDRNLKKDISHLHRNALDTILALQSREFVWRKNGEHDAGFVAQEVQKVLPEAVATNAESNLLSIKPHVILSYLVEAVKSLFVKLSGMEERVKKLEIENADLRERLQRLERHLVNDEL